MLSSAPRAAAATLESACRTSDRTSKMRAGRVHGHEKVPTGGDLATIRRLISEPRAILSPLRTIGVSDARAAFATLVGEVAQGRVRTIVAKGHLAVAIIPAPEYDRLRALNRAVSWFRGAGLDLATATEQQVIDFVRARRGQTGGAQGQSAG